VPGGAALPCAGVSVVGVLPTHRRRGILTSMMRAQLDDVRERGEPIAALFASEETIYGRFGYGLASLNLTFEVRKEFSAYRLGIEPHGAVRLVDPAEAAELFPPVYDAVRAATPGMFERRAPWWEHRTLADPPEWRFGGGPKHLAVLEVDGAPQAYAIYRLNSEFGSFGPETKARALEVLAATPEATVSIWRFLLDIDWTVAVSSWLAPVDHPLFLVLARPNHGSFRLLDGLWVRLVDVGAALSGRTYAGEGRIVFEVRDEFCPWNDGRWSLEDGVCERTDHAADLELDVADLGSAYLGGFTFRELARAGRVRGLTQGMLERADAMWRSDVAPWCAEIF
jgi:predicted acetyltransferase